MIILPMPVYGCILLQLFPKVNEEVKCTKETTDDIDHLENPIAYISGSLGNGIHQLQRNLSEIICQK